jgi:Ca2+-binding EF-hand superfamily protein
MLPALGALSSVLDALTTSSKSKVSTGISAGAAKSFDPANIIAPQGDKTTGTASSSTSSGGLSTATMSALLDAQSKSSTSSTASTSKTNQSSALKDLFAQLDGNGDGQVSKAEFESALGAGGTNTANADAVFGKLDKDGDGKVSLDELSAALKGKGHHHHAKSAGGASSGSSTSADGAADPLLAALSNSATVNTDGSTTRSL